MIRLVHWHRTLGVLLLVGAVAGGVAVTADGPAERAGADTPAGTVDAADLARQDQERADSERAARDTAQRKADEAAVAAAEQAKKVASPSQSKKPGATAPPAPESCNVYSGNRKTGCAMVLAKGWDLAQMGCLDKLWTKESGWNEKARNKSSGALGIPQAYPGSKMSSAGPDWETNPVTQIKWGLGYIAQKYNTPCRAWATSQSTGSY
ncbi:lytic transglycosylase domain-containing protein [Virgisporangium aurantiacum]|uniref:aggregation-promoting factor C-terminal-like domain-containing protein n=1 Tax=Virgisporangium aurantiacum TaxID=175570 RepID=UPI001951CCAB|nr:lytic transglycosylase domain-containing protein [Virgisporangium aurantiacum]